jgi:chemotaxis protein CheY-P-specific phosphatase CheC
MQRTLQLLPSLLTGAEIDSLRALAAHGSADVVRALGLLLGAQVEGTHPRAHVAAKGTVDKVLATSSEQAFTVHFTIEGGARMRQLIHFTPDGATLMAGLMLGAPLNAPLDAASTIYESALAEAGNIIVSSYLNGVGAAVGLTLVPSVPHVASGPLDGTTLQAFEGMDEVILLVTDLRLPGVRLAGRIITAIEEDGVGRLLALSGAR